MKKMQKVVMVLVTSLTLAGLTACKDDGDKRITSHKKYTLTVASVKLPGIISSCGNIVCTDVYAVKKENSTEWESFGGIANFEYEAGYEYQIRVSETNYLDYNMGEPAWTEYELLKILSKERKDSENLPSHFIPDWYLEYYYQHINSESDGH